MMKNKKNFSYFHSSNKGCEIEVKIFKRNSKNRDISITGGYCKTHQVDICKCGYQWHWHYGAYSLAKTVENSSK